jgi:hypothetical protein
MLLKGFWPLSYRSIIIKWGFLKDDILACVETLRLVIQSYKNILKDFGFF